LAEPQPGLSPAAWGQSFTAQPDLCSAGLSGLAGTLVRRWRGTGPTMNQPPLDHHYLAMHLGGPKRVERHGGGQKLTADCAPESLTFVPSGRSYEWHTRGPIGFAHLYLDPSRVSRVIQEEYDREPRSVELEDCVAWQHPLISGLFAAMIAEVENPSFASRLLLGSHLHSLIVTLLASRSTLDRNGEPARYRIAPQRLRRVLDFMREHFADDIELADLARLAGSSRFHFSRTFHHATGRSPHRALIHMRVHAAKAMLVESDRPIAEIAKACGFRKPSQFALMFRREFGASPSEFRRSY